MTINHLPVFTVEQHSSDVQHRRGWQRGTAWSPVKCLAKVLSRLAHLQLVKLFANESGNENENTIVKANTLFGLVNLPEKDSGNKMVCCVSIIDLLCEVQGE